ncbi:hypothetical protein ACHAWF_002070 [Thalassiosira exigua]
MSGRPSRPAPCSRDEKIDPKAERKRTLQRLHDATQIGDVNTVQAVFDAHAEFNVNTLRRGRNATLHTALLHNQEGPLIDYLLRNGADVDAENAKGYSPLTLAIVHCKGSKAVEKLIAAGATWTRFDTGAFAGLSAIDVGAKFKNESAVQLLAQMTEAGGDFCREVAIPGPLPRGRAVCPVCNLVVKFPTKMSRIESDQAAIELRIRTDGEMGTRHKKYISRKYMDQLLAHSDGEAYKKLCGIEYHGVENMRLRKEISESYGVLRAVQECWTKLGPGRHDPGDGVHMENVFLIGELVHDFNVECPRGPNALRTDSQRTASVSIEDLCSGKGITTALCGALDDEESNNHFLAIDRLLPHQTPHFLNSEKVRYLRRDVMAKEMFDEMAELVRQQTHERGRTCILVGMHLCGMLSERAVDFFERISEIRGLVLSPCCLPQKHNQSSFVKERPANDQENIELYNYFRWSEHLKERVAGVGNGVSDVTLYTDADMHTEKNVVIHAVKAA